MKKIVPLLALFGAISAHADVAPATVQYRTEVSVRTEKQIPPESEIDPLSPGTLYPQLKLKTGEIIENAKFLSATANGASFAVNRTIRSIPFKLLPPQIAIRAIDYAEWKLAGDHERAQQAFQVEARQRIQQENTRAAQAQKAEEARVEEEREAKKKEQWAGLERDGLRLIRLRTEMASVFVTIANSSDKSVSFEWRKMKARFRGGDIREPTTCIADDTEFGYEVPAGSSRRFQIGFGSRVIGDGRWLESVAWAEDSWQTYVDK